MAYGRSIILGISLACVRLSDFIVELDLTKQNNHRTLVVFSLIAFFIFFRVAVGDVGK